MTRLVLFLLGVLGAAMGLSWLADNPGTVTIDWLGYRAEPSVFQAVVIVLLTIVLATLLWSLARQLWTSPATVGTYFAKRRQRRGLDALSSGMIAIGAGDRGSASKYAIQARKSLPNEPLTHLLRAQAAQLSGDRATARRIFEAMLASPDTEQLGLRGLFLEAQREKEPEAQRQFADRAIKLNPKLGWPAEALFDLQCREGLWDQALATLATARRHHHIAKPAADRRRAVLLTAQAQALEETQADQAVALALEAHQLAVDLVPAAAIAGRLLASRGSTSKAAKVIQQTWAKAPHPDLATAYAYARIGDSPRDRYDRVKQLATLNPYSPETPVAVASAAIEAHMYDEARHALAPLVDGRLTRRVAMLMARIEAEQHGDRGRIREWLARAVHAGRDPAWTADGVVSEQWAPISPVTGALDAFQWRVPVEEAEPSDAEALTERLDRLVALVDGSPEAPETSVEPEVSIAPSESVILDAVAEEIEPPPAPQAKKPAPAASIRTIQAEEPPGAPPAEPAAARGRKPIADKAASQSKTAAAAAKASKSEKGKAEPHIFVPPHAPDDPGAESDDEEIAELKPPYRAIS